MNRNEYYKCSQKTMFWGFFHVGWKKVYALDLIYGANQIWDQKPWSIQWTLLFTATVVSSHLLFVVIEYENIFYQM